MKVIGVSKLNQMVLFLENSLPFSDKIILSKELVEKDEPNINLKLP
jgi:hypothetical protein